MANCKINLGLRILRRRADGFHDIETVMLPVRGLADTVSVTAFPDSAVFPAGVDFAGPFPSLASTPPPYPSPPPVFPADTVFEISGAAVDCPTQENICMLAMRMMQREFGIAEAHIGLHKAIPSGAGLGGGSSDAAAVLRAVNREFALELPDAELERLAAALGSDVPFFIRNTPQLCTGRGEIMTPVEVDLAGKWLVILKPAAPISTAEAYAGVTPRERSAGATARQYPGERDMIPLPEILKRDIGQWRELLVNDFEESVFALRPEIAALKALLYDRGALYASMSGSGSAVFGIFERRPAMDIEPDATGKAGPLFFHSEQFKN